MAAKVLRFEEAFKYPFNRAKGMLNILWILLPLFGWFALGGYSVRIVQEFIKGKYKKLPTMSFGSDMSLGFMMFLKGIPFFFLYFVVMAIIEAVSPVYLSVMVRVLVELLVIPMLVVNFVKKMTVGSLFEFTILEAVFNNLGDYLMAVVKSIGLAIVFLLLSVVLVGIPANAFTGNIFLANFYRRRIK